MVNSHDMLVVLNGLAENQRYANESFDKFKNDIVTALNKISEDHNVMKQELFILRQKQTISQTATTPPTEAPAVSTPIAETAKQSPPISPPAP